jgi:hypothetical protein
LAGRRIVGTLLCLLISLPSANAVSFEEISSGFHAIQSQRLHATLQFLASKHFKGRATGTPEAELTAAYIASIFQRNGLQPPPANAASHVQAFDLVQAVPLRDCRLTVTLGEGASLDLKPGEDFLPAPWAVDASGVTGSLVFAGYGISAPDLNYDDFANAKVRGNIAVVLSSFPGGAKQTRWDFFAQKDYEDPFEKAMQAQKAGAVAVLIVLPSAESIPSLDSLSFRNAKTVLVSDAEKLKIPALFLSYASAEKLFRINNAQDKLKVLQEKIDSALEPVSFQLGKSASLTARYDRKSLKGYNVIGIIPGSDPLLRQECVLIGAHHDHMGVGENQEIFFGADDDASGTTGLLELAEAFQTGPVRPRRSIVLVAWGAEELGLLGSRHYAQHPAFQLSKTVAMIQLDMIGRNEQRPAAPVDGIQEETPDKNTNTVNIAGSSFSPDLKQWFESCNRRTGLVLRYRYDSGQENLLKRSDHWCFLKSGIPSVFLFTGFHPDYHRPSDTADKINYDKMERIVRLLFLTTWELADQTQAPRFVSSTAAK